MLLQQASGWVTRCHVEIQNIVRYEHTTVFDGKVFGAKGSHFLSTGRSKVLVFKLFEKSLCDGTG